MSLLKLFGLAVLVSICGCSDSRKLSVSGTDFGQVECYGRSEQSITITNCSDSPIERCWSSLQQKWNGTLLTCWQVVKSYALRMTWKGEPPEVHCIAKGYGNEQDVSQSKMKVSNTRLLRSSSLLKYDVLIRPNYARCRWFLKCRSTETSSWFIHFTRHESVNESLLPFALTHLAKPFRVQLRKQARC